MEPTTLRPTHHLRQLAQTYPGLWPQVDQMRAQRGLQLPHWPAWCYLPLAGAVAIVTQGARAPDPATMIGPQISIVGALAAWRATQGLYRFDPDMFEALWTTALEGELPTTLLHHLPEWCVYLLCPTPRAVLGGTSTLHGYYAHLEWDANTQESELRLLLDVDTATGPELLPQALHLGEWSLEVAAQRALTTSLGHMARLGEDEAAQRMRASLPEATRLMADLCTPLVSVVLYLCSTAAEMRDAAGRREQPSRPTPTITKKGERLFAPSQPTTWEVGYRVGAALRAARQAEQQRTREGSESDQRAGPRSHIRRAHWHSYWTGKGRTTPRVRWLHPVLVGAQGAEGIIPTIHDVDA